MTNVHAMPNESHNLFLGFKKSILVLLAECSGVNGDSTSVDGDPFSVASFHPRVILQWVLVDDAVGFAEM